MLPCCAGTGVGFRDRRVMLRWTLTRMLAVYAALRALSLVVDSEAGGRSVPVLLLLVGGPKGPEPARARARGF